MNGSETERFETAYRRIWGALHRGDAPDLGQHELQLLHHVPPTGGVSLGWVAQHLLMPKSSASVLVKDLARRGFLYRHRDGEDERRLRIVLTAKGRRRVASDTVLDPRALTAALETLGAPQSADIVDLVERLADAASAGPRSGRSSALG